MLAQRPNLLFSGRNSGESDVSQRYAESALIQIMLLHPKVKLQ
jgi:hypothetical protein